MSACTRARDKGSRGRTLAPRFPVAQLLITPGALAAAIQASGDDAFGLLRHHIQGDWGGLDPVDVAENEFSLIRGFRMISAYNLKDRTKVWVITEADRSATTILLPWDY